MVMDEMVEHPPDHAPARSRRRLVGGVTVSVGLALLVIGLIAGVFLQDDIRAAWHTSRFASASNEEQAGILVELDAVGPAGRAAIEAIVFDPDASSDADVTARRQAALDFLVGDDLRTHEVLPESRLRRYLVEARGLGRSSLLSFSRVIEGPSRELADDALFALATDESVSGIAARVLYMCFSAEPALQVALIGPILETSDDPDTVDPRQVRGSASGIERRSVGREMDVLEAVIGFLPRARLSENRTFATWLLYELDLSGAGPEHVAVLARQAETDPSPKARDAAVAVLGVIPNPDAKSVAAIVGALDDDAMVRETAILALAKVGAAARDAVPRIARYLESGVPAGLRRYAANALGRIGGEDAVGALAAVLDDDDELVRFEATRGLRRRGEEARAHLGALRRALEDPMTGVRQEAAIAVATLDPEERRVIPFLREAATGPSGPVDEARAALRALGAETAGD